LTLLIKFHEGVCVGHFAGRITAKKILQGRYHWLTFLRIQWNIVRLMMCAKHL